MAKAHVTHAECNAVHVLRYFGRVDYMSAPAIQRFVDELLDRGQILGLVFDLTEAEVLDSTNLGLLARINERARRSGIGQSMIVSSNDDINMVLHSMGFDRTFAIVGSVELPSCGLAPDEIEERSPSQEELRQTMLDAHRALSRLSETGRLQFQDVIACLEGDCAPSSRASDRA